MEHQFCAASAMDKLVDLARPSDLLSPRSSLTWVDHNFQASHQPPQEMKLKILGSPVPSRVDGEMEMETLGPPKPDAVMERKKSRVGICSTVDFSRVLPDADTFDPLSSEGNKFTWWPK